MQFLCDLCRHKNPKAWSQCSTFGELCSCVWWSQWPSCLRKVLIQTHCDFENKLTLPERRSCFTLSVGDRGWRRVETVSFWVSGWPSSELRMQAAPKGLAFGAMAAAGQCAYLVGGRLRKGIAPGRGDRDRSS